MDFDDYIGHLKSKERCINGVQHNWFNSKQFENGNSQLHSHIEYKSLQKYLPINFSGKAMEIIKKVIKEKGLILKGNKIVQTRKIK